LTSVVVKRVSYVWLERMNIYKCCCILSKTFRVFHIVFSILQIKNIALSIESRKCTICSWKYVLLVSILKRT